MAATTYSIWTPPNNIYMPAANFRNNLLYTAELLFLKEFRIVHRHVPSIFKMLGQAEVKLSSTTVDKQKNNSLLSKLYNAELEGVSVRSSIHYLIKGYILTIHYYRSKNGGYILFCM